MMKRLRAIRAWVSETAVKAAEILLFWPEALQTIGIVMGWGLLTFGIASLLTWQVWPISGGLFLLSVVGWGHLKVVFGSGIYTLTKNKRKKVERG